MLLLSAREKVLNSFKSRLFPIKNLDKIPIHVPTPILATEPEAAKERATEPEVAKIPATEPEVGIELTKETKAKKAKSKRKISSLKLCGKFLSEIKLKIK